MLASEGNSFTTRIPIGQVVIGRGVKTDIARQRPAESCRHVAAYATLALRSSRIPIGDKTAIVAERSSERMRHTRERLTRWVCWDSIHSMH